MSRDRALAYHPMTPTVEFGSGLRFSRVYPAWEDKLAWWVERIAAAVAVAVWIVLVTTAAPLAGAVFHHS